MEHFSSESKDSTGDGIKHQSLLSRAKNSSVNCSQSKNIFLTLLRVETTTHIEISVNILKYKFAEILACSN